jgi:hypothetical protein
MLGAVALTAALALTGCASAGPADGYIEAYYDNGDPIRSPRKATLFDEAGDPLCATPIYQNKLETRFRPFSDTGGVVNAFLFEVTNNEQDPEAPISELTVPAGMSESAYRELLRRQQGSAERMYELTHPFLFDAENGISGPEDMEAIKQDLRRQFPELAPTAGRVAVVPFVSVGDSWIESSAGRYDVRRVGDVPLFMDTLGITGVEYNGLQNDYSAASKDGEEFLMIRDRESGLVTLVSADGVEDLDEIQQFQQYGIMLTAGVFESVAAVMTLQNDGCPQADGTNFARWWIADIEEVEPVVLPDEDEEDADGEEPTVDPSAAPSPSPEPSA